MVGPAATHWAHTCVTVQQGLVAAYVRQMMMNARHRHARTVVHAWMALDRTPAFVPVASQERIVRRTLMTAHLTPVLMGAHAQTATTHLHARAHLDM